MKRLFFAFFLLLTASSCGDPSLRIGSYNLWRSDLGKDDYAWSVRKHRLVQSIKDIEFDLFGAQEVDTTIIRELPLLFKEAGLDYTLFIFSPYREDGGVGNKAQAIIYNNRRLEMLDDHHFWYSETPDTISSGWDEIQERWMLRNVSGQEDRCKVLCDDVAYAACKGGESSCRFDPR